MSTSSVEPDSPFDAEQPDNAAQEPPRDAPLLSDDFGTTPSEARSGEPLAGRLAREEPDVLEQADTAADESAAVDVAPGAGQGVGRLMSPDNGARTDAEPDLVAADAGTDAGGFTAEEAAMHVEPEV